MELIVPPQLIVFGFSLPSIRLTLFLQIHRHWARWGGVVLSFAQLKYLCAVSQRIQIVCPALHHSLAFWKMRSSIVGAPIGIPDRVRQLVLNKIHPLSKDFIKNSARHGPEPVAAHDIFADVHAAHG